MATANRPGQPTLTEARDVPAGLCELCTHSERIQGRIRAYRLCRLSRIDSRYARYPPLPVLSCAGFAPSESCLGASDKGSQAEP